jgi:hypothetical protein
LLVVLVVTCQVALAIAIWRGATEDAMVLVNSLAHKRACLTIGTGSPQHRVRLEFLSKCHDFGFSGALRARALAL